MNDLVVVGASVATTAFIERIRELGNTQRIVAVDIDPDAPYDRPPLSKHYLVHGDADDMAVDWGGFDVELVQAAAVGVSLSTNTLHVRDEQGRLRDVSFGQLVIASGAYPARLPFEPSDTLVLRSAADARRLRSETRSGQSVIIIGAGAIGVELASSLATRDIRVVVLDRAAAPLERLLAGHLASETTQWLDEAGVVCRWQVDLVKVSRSSSGWTVTFADGEELSADLVISAVGSRPAVEWLAQSGMLSDGALVVDEDGRVVTGDGVLSNVFAIGDAVTRRNSSGHYERTESWAAARQHGAHLAEYLCGAPRQPASIPYYWTEVAGRKIQVVGTLQAGLAITLEDSNVEKGSALYRVGDHDATVAWIGVNAQPRIARILMGASAGSPLGL